MADDITVYPSQQAYYDSQEGFDVSNSPLQDEIPNLGNELKFAAESIVCPWLFELAFNSESIDKANSIAMVSAVVEGAELVTNQLTGRQWYKVDAHCIVPMTFAMPASTQPAPAPGAILSGTAILTGSTGYWRALADRQ